MNSNEKINNKVVPLTGEQKQKLPPFQNLPATPQSVQQALALLAQFEHESKNQNKLATPGNPNPEAAVEELGGVVASFLFRNARTLLESYMVLNTEYYPLIHGVHALLSRGPFSQRIASAVVAGFATMAAEQQKAEVQPGNGADGESI